MMCAGFFYTRACRDNVLWGVPCVGGCNGPRHKLVWRGEFESRFCTLWSCIRSQIRMACGVIGRHERIKVVGGIGTRLQKASEILLGGWRQADE